MVGFEPWHPLALDSCLSDEYEARDDSIGGPLPPAPNDVVPFDDASDIDG